MKYTDPSGYLTWAEKECRKYTWGETFRNINGKFYSEYDDLGFDFFYVDNVYIDKKTGGGIATHLDNMTNLWFGNNYQTGKRYFTTKTPDYVDTFEGRVYGLIPYEEAESSGFWNSFGSGGNGKEGNGLPAGTIEEKTDLIIGKHLSVSSIYNTTTEGNYNPEIKYNTKRVYQSTSFRLANNGLVKVEYNSDGTVFYGNDVFMAGINKLGNIELELTMPWGKNNQVGINVSTDGWGVAFVAALVLTRGAILSVSPALIPLFR